MLDNVNGLMRLSYPVVDVGQSFVLLITAWKAIDILNKDGSRFENLANSVWASALTTDNR